MIFQATGRRFLQIQTPEGVIFHLGIAGLFSRTLAWIVDGAVIATASYVLGIVTQFAALISPDFAKGISVVAYAVLSVGYGIFTEWQWRGQSWGKRLLRLRVIDASGLKLQFNQIVIRNLLRPVDILPVAYLLGGITAFATRHGQRLGDLAANTVVVSIPETLVLDTHQLQESKYNSFRDFPHLEARLRQKIKPAEVALAIDAILRRDEMTPEARLDLFREIAAHFRKQVTFEERIDEMITDEQFVRNTIASIYRQSNSRKTTRREVEEIAG